MAFHYAHENFRLMSQANFASAHADFEKQSAANGGLAKHLIKSTVRAASTSGAAEAMARSAGGSVVGLITQQRQLTRVLGHIFGNPLSHQAISEFRHNL